MDYVIIEMGRKQVEVPACTVLQDDRFEWRAHKEKTVKLAALYDMAGFSAYAERSRTCATWLQYQVTNKGEKDLIGVNFCHLRLCPMCTARRSRRAAYKLSQVLDFVEGKHGAMFLFLTLTIRNVDGAHLGEAISQLTRGWNLLIRNRQFERSIKGWFRAVEVTRHNNGYHPHIHAILAVEPKYFTRGSGLYISHDEFVDRWRKSLRVDYNPSVRIQTAKAKGEFSAGRAAAVEAAKYAVKDSDYIDPSLPDAVAVEIVKDYTNALFRKRMTAFGGWMKEAAALLDSEDLEDGDLVHLDNTVREDIAEFIETYRWHFGAGDYILSHTIVNPLKLEHVK